MFILCLGGAVAWADQSPAEAFPLPDGRRHVILDGASPAVVGGLFGHDEVVFESQTLTSVPWRPIDAVAFGPARLATAQALAADLLARGIVVVVATESRPPGPWPWQRVSGGWMARYGVVGPSRFVAPGVYASVDLRPVGRPAGQRRELLLLVTLYALGALGTVVLIGSFRGAVMTLFLLSASASAGLLLWGSLQERLHSTGVSVIIQSGDLRQVDRWTFERAPAPTDRQIDPAITGWPVFRSPVHRDQSRAAVVGANSVSYRLDRRTPMALLQRSLTAQPSPPVSPAPLPLRWRSLVSQYRAQGVEVLGMTSGPADDSDSTIWLRREPPGD
jgi:hypothetical protein